MNSFDMLTRNACRFLNEDVEDELPMEAPALPEEMPVDGDEDLGLDGEVELEDDGCECGDGCDCEGECDCDGDSVEALKAQIADLQSQVSELIGLVSTLTGEAGEEELVDDDLAGEDDLGDEDLDDGEEFDDEEELEDDEESFTDDDI